MEEIYSIISEEEVMNAQKKVNGKKYVGLDGGSVVKKKGEEKSWLNGTDCSMCA